MTPVSPKVYGSITPEVRAAVNNMRDRSEVLVRELGLIELRKLKVVKELAHLEEQSQALLKGEAKRLEIPPTTPWQLTPEGVALGVPDNG